jgi:hypothetical protein
MVEKTSETKRKRLPRSQRKYIRRQKQAARKAGTEPRLPTSESRP